VNAQVGPLIRRGEGVPARSSCGRSSSPGSAGLPTAGCRRAARGSTAAGVVLEGAVDAQTLAPAAGRRARQSLWCALRNRPPAPTA